MVEKKIGTLFQKIFDVREVTFNRPSPEAAEQDILFVEVSRVVSSVRNGSEHYRVEGRAFMFTQNEKMPIGFFAKKIQSTEPANTKDFFFYSVDGLQPQYMNIAQRGFEFVYLYSGQYNPPAGNIVAVNFNHEEPT